MAFNSGLGNGGGSYGANDDRHIFLPEGRGEQKVSIDLRKRIQPATHCQTWVGTFTIVDEDHTVGQVLRHSLASDKRVLTSGYLIPHPLENIMRLHIQTVDNYLPQQALSDAIDRFVEQLGHLSREVDLQINTIRK